MKHLLQINRFMVMLVAMLTLSLTSAWGATIANPYVGTPSGSASKDGGEITLSNVTWTYGSAGYLAISSSMFQIGSNKNPQTSGWTISTPISSFGQGVTITKVKINAKTGGTGSYDISVGGTSKKSGNLSTTATDYETSTLAVTEGNVAITITGATKAAYLGTITITYTTGGGSDPSLSLSPTSIDFGSVEQGGSVEAKSVTATLTNTTYAAATLSGTNADAFEITAGEELTETGTITVQPKAATLQTAGTYTASLDVDADQVADTKSATISLTVTAPATAYDVVHDFTQISGFSDWSSTYTERVVNYTDDKVVFASANKQTSTITNMPVTKGQPVSLVLTNAKKYISKVKFECAQWSSNAQTITLNYSKDGGETYSSTSTKSSNFTLESELPDSVNAVKFTFNNTSKQVGISKLSFNMVDRQLASSAVNITAPAAEQGTLVVKNGETTVTSGSLVEETTVLTIVAAPLEGFKLQSVSVVDADANEVEVDANNQFVMPAKAVTVSATFVQAKVLNSVEITKQPTTKEFWKGDTFTSEGLELTAHFSTGDSVVTPTSIFGYDMATPGEQTVTVSYTEGTVTKSDSYDITVKTIGNTPATAYTTAEAIAIIDAGKDLNTRVYVKGTVSQVDKFNETYKSITYWLDDNAFEIYSGKNIDSTDFVSINDIQVNDEVVVFGNILYYSKTSIYEMNVNNYLASLYRPNVLQSIALSGDTIKNFTVGDAFSHEGMVVTAKYNVHADSIVTDYATWSGYDMSVANNYTVTVSYTENEVEKTATYDIVVSPSSSCVKVANIEKGEELNGTFELSVSGEQCADEAAISTVLTAEPAEHYHLASVTSINAQEQTVGTIGEIVDNECTISGIEESTTITAVFAENAKATATFAKGVEEATGTAPADIEEYVGEDITLPANTFSYAGHKFAGWSDGTNTFAAGASYEMPEGGKAFTATWEELPVWATTYTSNVTLGSDKVKVNGESTEYKATKAGTSKAAGSTTVKVPVGTIALHFHAVGWSGESVTLKVSKGSDELGSFDLNADAGMTSNTPYTLQTKPEDNYYSVVLSNITEETTITFAATTGKRFAIYGVNAVQPAELTIDPESYDFGNVKENASANKVFTVTPNAFVEGTLSASFEGADAAKFSAVVNGNNVTVTFTPAAQGAMAATLKVAATNAFVTASLTGTGVPATTPEIVVPAEPVDFGKVKQDSAVADQQVIITLNNLEAATAAISGTTFSINKTALVAGENTITISANTSVMGVVADTITITGAGAETKKIAVKMDVLSKWADIYTSNVGDDVLTDEVVIGGEKYDAIKKGTGTASQSAVISVPKGTQTLHFHAAAWNNEATVLVVKQGDTELGSFDLYKDAGVKSSSPFTLQGNNYSTEQYFHVSVATYTATDAADITFTTTASPYRFVLYGVNQEGGILPVLDRIEIGGTAAKTEYEVGDTFDPAGLTVSAIYKLEGVDQPAVDVTDDVAWTFEPATLTAGEYNVTATATYETKQASKDVAVSVVAPTPTITVDTASVAFGTVAKGSVIEAKTVAVTLKAIEGNATVTLAGEGASAFSIDLTELAKDTFITITPNTADAGVFAATITIAANGAESKEVALSMTVAEMQAYTLVTDAATLHAGDVIVLGATKDDKSFVNGAMGEEKYFSSLDAQIDNDILYAVGAMEITLGAADGGMWTLTTSEGTIGTKKVKELIKDGTAAQNKWSISIADDGAALIKDNLEEQHNPIKYNSSSPRFTTYANGQTAIKIYRKAVKVTETRLAADFAQGTISTICLSGDVAAADIAGCTVYELAGKDADPASVVYCDQVTSMEAGKPYIIKLNDGASEATFSFISTNTEAQSASGLVGTYTKIEKAVDNILVDNYILYQDAVKKCGENCSLGARKAYIVIDDVPVAGAAAPGRRRIALGTSGTNTPTELINVNANVNANGKFIKNGQMFILRDGKMFNAQGQLVK